MGIVVGKRLFKLSIFCVIIIVVCLVSNSVKRLLHPDVGGVLSNTGIMANKFGMFILIICM